MRGTVKSALWTLDLSDAMSIVVRPCRFQHSSRYIQIKEISEDGFSRVVNVSDYNFVKVFSTADRRVEMSANQHRILSSTSMIFYQHGRPHFTISIDNVNKINDNYAQILMRLLPNLMPFNEAATETEAQLEKDKGGIGESAPAIKIEPPLPENDVAKNI
jgi:hypothetical protein